MGYCGIKSYSYICTIKTIKKLNNMATAKTSTNLKYNQVNHYLGISNELKTGSKEWYQAIKKAGYKFAYRWINSDTNWMYFATNNARACEGAAELYATEKKSDIKTAREYYSEYVEVYSLDEIINNWF
jgi:hypothetical protein